MFIYVPQLVLVGTFLIGVKVLGATTETTTGGVTAHRVLSQRTRSSGTTWHESEHVGTNKPSSSCQLQVNLLSQHPQRLHSICAKDEENDTRADSLV